MTAICILFPIVVVYRLFLVILLKRYFDRLRLLRFSDVVNNLGPRELRSACRVVLCRVRQYPSPA